MTLKKDQIISRRLMMKHMTNYSSFSFFFSSLWPHLLLFFHCGLMNTREREREKTPDSLSAPSLKTCIRFYYGPSVMRRILLKDGPGLTSTLAGNNSTNGVWRKGILTALITQLGVYSSTDDWLLTHRATQREPQSGRGGGRGCFNDFLKMLFWRLGTLFSLVCNPLALLFTLHLGVSGRGFVGGKVDGWDSGMKGKADFGASLT